MSYFWRPFVGTGQTWQELWGRCDMCLLSGPACEFIDMQRGDQVLTLCVPSRHFPGCHAAEQLLDTGWTRSFKKI